MLSKEQILEIREHLERAQNPIFFFDNDVDGLMSFVLLRRLIGRGNGVAIKSFPALDVSYSCKIEELNADYIFILDKPVVSEEFFESFEGKNIPIVWIDHHDVEVNVPSSVDYYNPVFSKDKSSEPVSYIAYEIVNNKKDIWISMAGCIGDNFMPPFYQDFAREYPQLWKKGAMSAFEILYEGEVGKMVNIFNFALKDRTTNVVSMMNFLFKVNSPSDVLVESEKNFKILKRYEEVKKVYDKLIERAKRIARSSRRLVFFQYGGNLSMSADLANELSYRFPGKVIMVAYVKGASANVSVRGSVDVREITLGAVEKIESARGGGHKNATGSKMMVEDLPKFREYFESALRV